MIKLNVKFYLVFICTIAFLLRFWKLAEIPQGVSLEEVTFGNNLLSIRLPFAFIGFISVPTFYFLVKKFKYSQSVALTATFILAILPWHVEQSRIYSLGIILFFLIELLFLLVLLFFTKHAKKFFLLCIGLSAIIFVLGVFRISETAANSSLAEKNLVFRTGDMQANSVGRVFSNPIVHSYRENLQTALQSFDIGVLVFNGHPRERLGNEETVKLTIIVLLFVFMGITRLSRKSLLPILATFLLAISVLSFLNYKGPDLSLILLPSILLLMCLGVEKVIVHSKVFISMLVLLVLEVIFIYVSYFSGLTESSNSPRFSIYSSIAQSINNNQNNFSKVIVSDEFGNPDTFLKFYINDEVTEGKIEIVNLNSNPPKDINTLYIDSVNLDDINDPFSKLQRELLGKLITVDSFFDTKTQKQILIYKVI